MSAQDIRPPTTVTTSALSPRPTPYRSRFPEIQASSNAITLSPQTLELQRERIRNLRMSTITDTAICLFVVGVSGLIIFLLFTNRIFVTVK
jgi:hypothetical protein